MIGINDIARGTSPDMIIDQIDQIIQKIQLESPTTIIYLQSILPVNNSFGMFEGHTSRWETIKPLNKRLANLANKRKIIYINLYSYFVTPGTDKLNPQYTNDGLHLLGDGYIKWVELVKPYINE
jgi:lysophospholipase L1-like esterase